MILKRAADLVEALYGMPHNNQVRDLLTTMWNTHTEKKKKTKGRTKQNVEFRNCVEFRVTLKAIKTVHHVTLYFPSNQLKSILVHTSTSHRNITETSLSVVEGAQGASSLQRSSRPLLEGRSSIARLSAESAGLLNYLDSEWGSASGHVCLGGNAFLSASPFPQILSSCHLPYKYSHKDSIVG